MNCKQEFLEEIEGRSVLCAVITMGEVDYDDPLYVTVSRLKVGYTASDFTDFLKSLDYTYDSGYGRQEVFGTIWYTDGTWSERGEYDGSEWWTHKSCPEIPMELKEVPQ